MSVQPLSLSAAAAGNGRFGVSWAAGGAAAVSRRCGGWKQPRRWPDPLDVHGAASALGSVSRWNDLQMIGELVAGSSFSLSVTPGAIELHRGRSPAHLIARLVIGLFLLPFLLAPLLLLLELALKAAPTTRPSRPSRACFLGSPRFRRSSRRATEGRRRSWSGSPGGGWSWSCAR